MIYPFYVRKNQAYVVKLILLHLNFKADSIWPILKIYMSLII